ncbi:hypothetical protein MNBD_ALPHA09-912 [hydrothermal vent metagenome]|uniref:Uncharacterized protein n=1 Tax=hydrothermal vent metagenome TaxID=652676 RepID=A0A3B0T508_9ZZZZ
MTQVRLGGTLVAMTRHRSLVFTLLTFGLVFLEPLLGAQMAFAQEDTSVFQPMRSGDDQTLLNSLYDDLAKAPDEATATALADSILKVWVRSSSDTIDLLTRRAQVAMEAADDATTLALLDAVVDIAPNFVEGWNRRATYYFTKKDYPSAMADVQRVLALDPRHFGALSGLGAMLLGSGQDAAALDVYRRALKVHPFLPGAKRAAKDLQVEVEGRKI